MASIDVIAPRVKQMRVQASVRDDAMRRIDRVRSGDIDQLMPDAFSDEIPRSVAANFIDTAARDISELVAPLPTLEFNDETASSKAKKDFASKKTNIGYGYWFESNLQLQMFTGCDQYLTYGFLPFLVEADYDRNAPHIYVMNPSGSYYHLDRQGNTVCFANVITMKGAELADFFPEYASAIMEPVGDRYGQKKDPGDQPVEIVRYWDKDTCLYYLPERKNTILGQVENKLGRCPVVVAERPGNAGPRGQFDDAVPVQLARSYMARLGIDAAYKSVNAPLAVPEDVNEFPVGPDVIIRTREPDKIRRVGAEISPAAFSIQPMLEAEMRLGTRYPDARSGEMQASVITGRGVQALQGTIDTQIKTAQYVIGIGLQKTTMMAYELDEKVWPNRSRKFYATIGGQAISETYVPSKDIRGDYRCDTVYGFAAGLGVNQAVVMIAQMMGAGLIPRSSARRHLPLGEDPNKLEREMNAQQLRDGLVQGAAAMAQSANVTIEQGGDPSPILAKVAQMVTAVMSGDSIEDAYMKAFPPPPPAPAVDPNAPPGAPGPPGADGAPAGMNDLTGLPMGTAKAGEAPGGRPGLQQLVAGLTGAGKANLGDNVAQRIPTLG